MVHGVANKPTHFNKQVFLQLIFQTPRFFRRFLVEGVEGKDSTPWKYCRNKPGSLLIQPVIYCLPTSDPVKLQTAGVKIAQSVLNAIGYHADLPAILKHRSNHGGFRIHANRRLYTTRNRYKRHLPFSAAQIKKSCTG